MGKKRQKGQLLPQAPFSDVLRVMGVCPLITYYRRIFTSMSREPNETNDRHVYIANVLSIFTKEEHDYIIKRDPYLKLYERFQYIAEVQTIVTRFGVHSIEQYKV